MQKKASRDALNNGYLDWLFYFLGRINGGASAEF